jgi:hypothetical protein
MIIKIFSALIGFSLAVIPPAMIETESCHAQANKGEAK